MTIKYKTTQKGILSHYGKDKVLSVQYCALQHLLRYVQPTAYTTRAEGWGADIYEVHGAAIATGYAPFGTRVDHNTAHTFDWLAEDIQNAEALGWGQKRDYTAFLLEVFVKRPELVHTGHSPYDALFADDGTPRMELLD